MYPCKRLKSSQPSSFLGQFGFGKLTQPREYKIFFGSAPIKEVLGSRSLILNQHCYICKREIESTFHVLADCRFSMTLWNRLGILVAFISSFTKPLPKWPHLNGTSSYASKIIIRSFVCCFLGLSVDTLVTWIRVVFQ